jgi:hypothetical protein
MDGRTSIRCFLAIGPEPGCYLVYNQPLHALAIARTVLKGQGSARAIPGHPGALSGEHCSVDPRNVAVTAAGEALTLTLPVVLDPSLAKADAPVQTGVSDFAKITSGWTEASDVFSASLQRSPVRLDALDEAR